MAKIPDSNGILRDKVLTGPLRVFPGRLSVSRTFGDIEAKIPRLGGNPNVIIAIPDITVTDIDSNCDFFVLACDGIFDKLNNQDTIDCVWQTYNL